MDQSSSHDVSSTVGSGGRSVSSEITLSRVAAELQALESFSHETETPSEQADHKAMESAYIGYVESLYTGDDGKEEGEYTGEDPDENEPEEESTTPQVKKTMKGTKPGRDESKEGGVDG
ncbi:MAG: hypothetical protein GY835_18535 [bacterium]|nr:hypothetical protein [bacterium]